MLEKQDIEIIRSIMQESEERIMGKIRSEAAESAA